jgi:hypothetical protein
MSFLRKVWDEFSGTAAEQRRMFEVLEMAADRIREVADEHHATYSQGMRMAADLIDPRVDL